MRIRNRMRMRRGNYSPVVGSAALKADTFGVLIFSLARVCNPCLLQNRNRIRNRMRVMKVKSRENEKERSSFGFSFPF